ncbi:MAG: plasma-membrane proton-efflux P-type ATPase [Chitinophagaceae bacterium]|nr:plasma-membrane proton-efflux P-type ATPase [Chitinophagaceae bacterium]
MSPTDLKTGLTDAEVATLRLQHGFNEVKEKQSPAIILFARHFWGLTAWMLEATVVISFLLNKTFDAIVILALLIFNALIGFFNEQKAAKTVAALQQQLQVMVRVLRNSNWLQISSKELVPGDIVRIRTGDFLTADMQLLDGEIKADKSALTGESALIDVKKSDILYAGSIAKGGEGTTMVTATGTQSFFGKTAKLVMTASHKMHMEEVVAKVVRLLFISVISVLTITTVIGLISGQGLLTVLPLILILLVSAVPVGMPAMFTISMARGSKELAENGLLVSRLSATEDAATLTTLCIDKTGTITKNELSLKQTVAFEQFTLADVLMYGAMASVKADNDVIDLAFIDEAEKQKLLPIDFKQEEFIPFNASIKHTEATVFFNGNRCTVAKGAFVAIKNMCNITSNQLDKTVDDWALKGFKTIAVAVAKRDSNFQLVGIAALFDPPREDAATMLAAIKDLGVDIKMLTGDALPIGKEIAGQVGIGNNVVSMAAVREQMAIAEERIKMIQSCNGFAEVLPEDKFNIVKSLQQAKQIIGMTGDGVNDAPALKQAEVGIAMKNATDVAKQAASIILLKEGLQQILELIRVGRSIHVRIANYTVNKIAKTIQTILFVCVSFIISKQFVVATIDMVILLFLIDFAVLALAVDKVSWSRQPANWNIKPLVKKGVLIGVLLFAECITWFFAAKSLFKIQDPNMYHTLGFACLFFSSIASIPVIRTDKRFYKEPISKTLVYVLLADVLIVCVMLAFGFTGFAALPVSAIGATLFYFIVVNWLINDYLKVHIKF